MQLGVEGLWMTRLPSALALGTLVVAEVAGDSTDSSSSSTGDAIASNTHGRSPQHQCGSTAISRTTVCVVSAFGVVPDGYLATGVGKLGMAHPATARTTRLLTKLFATTSCRSAHPLGPFYFPEYYTYMSLMKQDFRRVQAEADTANPASETAAS